MGDTEVLMLIVAVLVISIACSTKADRDAARERMRPIGRRLMPVAIALWAVIIWGLARGPPR